MDMRVTLWGVVAPVLLALLLPTRAAALDCTAADAIAGANRARRVLGQLDRLEAIVWRERRRSRALFEEIEQTGRELEEMRRLQAGMTFVVGTRYENRRFGGLTSCAADRPVRTGLSRGWVGIYEEMRLGGLADDVRLPYDGGRIFYLSSYDGLHIPDRLLRWSDTLFGFSHDWNVGLRTTLAATYESVPESAATANWVPSAESREGGWGLLASFSLTDYGLRLAVATQPNLDGISLAHLQLDTVELPGGMRFGSAAGYLHQESPLVVAVGVYDIPGGFAVETGGYPLQLDPGFARLRWSHSLFEIARLSPRPERASSTRREEPVVIYEAEPFLQSSVSYLPPVSDDPTAGWRPGFVAGVDARLHMLPVGFGLRAEIGVNDARDLLAVPELDGRFFWGVHLFAQLWG